MTRRRDARVCHEFMAGKMSTLMSRENRGHAHFARRRYTRKQRVFVTRWCHGQCARRICTRKWRVFVARWWRPIVFHRGFFCFPFAFSRATFLEVKSLVSLLISIQLLLSSFYFQLLLSSFYFQLLLSSFFFPASSFQLLLQGSSFKLLLSSFFFQASRLQLYQFYSQPLPSYF